MYYTLPHTSLYIILLICIMAIIIKSSFLKGFIGFPNYRADAMNNGF